MRIASVPVGEYDLTTATGKFLFRMEATTNANYGSLLTLGNHYATAGSAAGRAANVAAADYVSGALGSWLNSLYSLALPSIAVVLVGIIMVRSPFGKRIAYLGISAGAFGLIAVSGWDLAVLLNSVLEGIWLILVGRCLYFRYAAPDPVVLAESPQESAGLAPHISLSEPVRLRTRQPPRDVCLPPA